MEPKFTLYPDDKEKCRFSANMIEAIEQELSTISLREVNDVRETLDDAVRILRWIHAKSEVIR